MNMNIIGALSDPQKDAQAFDPVLQEFAKTIAAALGAELHNTQITITSTITLSKKV